MKFVLRPEHRAKVKLFAHSGEAIVFWLCIAGLLFLAIVSVFRYVYLKTIVEEYREIGENLNPVLFQIQKLAVENDSLRMQQKGLHDRLGQLNSETERLNREVSQLSARPTIPDSAIVVLPIE